MKAIHSLWTKTTHFAITRNGAILLAAAAAFTNRAFEQTELVTDAGGLRIAERLGLEFLTYQTALDDFCSPTAMHVWALGKIQAQNIQTAPCIHIDNDLLFYHLPPRRIRTAAVAVQSTDEPEGYNTPGMVALRRHTGHEHTTALNCGVIAWNDMALMDEYCSRAHRTALIGAPYTPDGRAVSLVAEQAVLGKLLTERGIRAEPLIPMATEAAPHDFSDCLFTHLWATTKEKENWARKVEMMFSREFPGKYLDACRGIPALQKSGLIVSNDPL